MNKRKIIILGIAFIIMFAIGLMMYMNYVGSGKTKENGDIYNENNYQKSNNKINVLDTDKKAQVIRNVTTSAKILSISFEGIDDNDTMTNVLELLDKYKVKATFIVSGIDSAENPDILNQIKDEGHEIGNASLNYKNNK